MSLFDSLKNWWAGDKKKGPKQPVPMKPITYPSKIILAWNESLKGNQEISQWLLENGYKELIMASSAIFLRDEARNWLMENGYPHLMAFINASEGNEKARKWLEHQKLNELLHMSLAIDNDKKGWEWLRVNSTEDIFLLCKTINQIKNRIEENHNDIHSIHKD